MRALAYVLCLCLLPAAAAEWNETKPDCPPDMMCTMSYGDGQDFSGYNESHVAPPAADDAAVDADAKDVPATAALAAIGALLVALIARRA